MIDKSFTKFALILTLSTLACRLASPASDSPKPVPVQETLSAPTISISNISVDQIKNAQYQLGARDDRALIQLNNGEYQQGADTTTMDYAHVTMTDFIALGDLNGDGIHEAVAIVFENYGGTGNFAFLALYANVNGLPVFLSSVMLDDRPLINQIAIENGEVYLDAVIHGIQDPSCCPALPNTRRYVLINNQLRLVNYTTNTPNNLKRVIEITSPVNNSEVTGSVQVSGSISIAPFENTLAYFLYDENGNQLDAHPVMVTAPDFGAPGTFNDSIILTNISSNSVVYLEIRDLSAADGSILALDSVKLIVK